MGDCWLTPPILPAVRRSRFPRALSASSSAVHKPRFTFAAPNYYSLGFFALPFSILRSINQPILSCSSHSPSSIQKPQNHNASDLRGSLPEGARFFDADERDDGYGLQPDFLPQRRRALPRTYFFESLHDWTFTPYRCLRWWIVSTAKSEPSFFEAHQWVLVRLPT